MKKYYYCCTIFLIQYRVQMRVAIRCLQALYSSTESLHQFQLPVCERVLRHLVNDLVDDRDLTLLIYTMRVTCEKIFAKYNYDNNEIRCKSSRARN